MILPTRIEQQCKALGFSADEISAYERYRSNKQAKQFLARLGKQASRDSQQSKVYNAEWAYQKVHGVGTKFDSIEECRKYINRIVKSKTWEKLCNGKAKTLTVEEHRSQSYLGLAHWGGHITLNKSGMNKYVILHEMAHCSGGNMHHDFSFCDTLLKLVSRFIGREEAVTLKKCFKEKNVRYRKPSNKTATPEKWIVGYRRMQLARQKKSEKK